MSYVPNPLDASQPTEDKFVESAAAEFRSLKQRVNTLAASVAPGGDPVYGGIVASNFSMSAATINRRVTFSDTQPLGWNTRPGRMTADFVLRSNNYFAMNPSGHLAMVLRCDVDTIATIVSGSGIAVGALMDIGLPISDDGPYYKPAAMIETWAKQVPNSDVRWLFPYTWSGETKKMVDGVDYRFIIESTIAVTGVKYIRYRRYRYFAARSAWDLEMDTGDVLDHNSGADFSEHGFAIGEVFGDNLGPWSLDFSGVTITWGPPHTSATDARHLLNRYGAEVEGDISFVGDSRKILVKNSGATNTWTTFMSDTLNGATQVIVKPNGTSNVASYVAINNSNQSSFGAVAMAMQGSYASIGTTGFGGSPTPVLRIEYGPGNPLMQFNSAGAFIQGAGLALGREPGTFANLTGLAGTNARAFANSGSPLNMENFCGVGQITALINGVGGVTAANMENLLRPLYCLLSTSLGLSMNKGTV